MRSVSQLPRLEACPASEALPATRTVTVSPYASKGTVIHEFLRDVNQVGLEKALEGVPDEHLNACKAIDVSKLPACDPDSYAVEVAIAWDWMNDTARELGRGLKRDYSSCTENELPGQIDVLGLTPDAVVVHDYKSGYRYLGPAEESLQLIGYAVAAATLFNRQRAVVSFIRLQPNGEAYWKPVDLDLLDLDAGKARIRAIIEAVTFERQLYEASGTEALTIVEGGHCQYCPAFAQCPAKMKLAGMLAIEAGKPVPTSDLFPLPITELNFPLLLQRYELAQELLDRVGGILSEYGRGTPVKLPSGEMYGPIASTKEEISDIDAAKVVLADRYGQVVADRSVATHRTLTWAALERELRGWMDEVGPDGKTKVRPGLKISHVTRAAREALREAKAVRADTSYPVKRYRPKATKPALPAATESKSS